MARFSKIVLALAMLVGTAFAAAPSAEWTHVYSLDIPENANNQKGWDKRKDIPYTIDNCKNFDDSGVPFYKVAYEMILDGVTVWTEFRKPQLVDNDDGTPGEMMTACTSGLPVDWTYNTNVQGLAVRVTNGNEDGSLDDLEREGEVGSIEFWSNCYGKGEDGIWDHLDHPDDRVDCYGSMQVHHATGTVMAFNAWSYNLLTEMGIGDCPPGGSCHPDWTFAQNANDYDTRILNVYLKTVADAPTPSPTPKPTDPPTYTHPCEEDEVVLSDGSCYNPSTVSGMSASSVCSAGTVKGKNGDCVKLCAD